MSRNIIVNGECLASIKGGAHSLLLASLAELGLTSEQVEISPRFVQRGVVISDFGPEVPAEVQVMAGQADIRMTLVHYDRAVLDACMAESTAVGSLDGVLAGVVAPGGTTLGRGRPLYASGCHYMSLNLTSPVLNFPWRFPTAYILMDQSFIMPIGTERTLAQLTWRAIPYASTWSSGVSLSQSGAEIIDGLVKIDNGFLQTSGIVLWDHTPTSG